MIKIFNWAQTFNTKVDYIVSFISLYCKHYVITAYWDQVLSGAMNAAASRISLPFDILLIFFSFPFDVFSPLAWEDAFVTIPPFSNAADSSSLWNKGSHFWISSGI